MPSEVRRAADWHELALLRPSLVAYARRRLPDPSLAEDLVHDVFEVVVTRRAAFEGRSTLKSWLVGILKHKIVDVHRQRQNREGTAAGEDEAGTGSFDHIPCPGPTPDVHAEHRERLRRTLQRLEQLPAPMRRAIERRCLDDEDPAPVCRELGITPANLYVRVHRARRALAEG